MDKKLNPNRDKEVISDKSFQWVEYSPVCTKVIDLDFKLQYMSVAGVKDLKIDNITDYYGKPYPFHIYPDPYNEIMRNNLNEARKTGEIIKQEIAVISTKGEKLWFHTTFVPVKDE